MLFIKQVQFVKVIVIQVDLLESQIVDEKHFPTWEQAKEFQDEVKEQNSNLVCVMCQM